MKKALFAAALPLAVLTASPAYAAQIVQSVSDFYSDFDTMNYFDKSVGRLNFVRITVDGAINRAVDVFTDDEPADIKFFGSGYVSYWMDPYGDITLDFPEKSSVGHFGPYEQSSGGIGFSDIRTITLKGKAKSGFIGTGSFDIGGFMMSDFDYQVLSGNPDTEDCYHCNWAASDLTLVYDYDDKATTPLPEPISWALMLTGFGAIGAAMRRRPLALVGGQLR
jgi:hypothetical protein